MHIRDLQLAVGIEGETAVVTITFVVVLQERDYTVGGGFLESVELSAPLTHLVVPARGSLPIDKAVRPSSTATYRELPRSHTFRVPRYPSGPYATTRFHGHVEIWPAVALHDVKDTNDGVLPAKYPTFTLIEQARVVIRRLR